MVEMFYQHHANITATKLLCVALSPSRRDHSKRVRQVQTSEQRFKLPNGTHSTAASSPRWLLANPKHKHSETKQLTFYRPYKVHSYLGKTDIFSYFVGTGSENVLTELISSANICEAFANVSQPLKQRVRLGLRERSRRGGSPFRPICYQRVALQCEISDPRT